MKIKEMNINSQLSHLQLRCQLYYILYSCITARANTHDAMIQIEKDATSGRRPLNCHTFFN